MRRKTVKKLLAVAFATILIASFVLAFVACDGNEPTPDPYDGYLVIDVMSFNIRMDAIIDFGDMNWSSSRSALVTDYIKSSGANVICLQEVCQNQYEDICDAVGDIYSVVYYKRESGYNPEGLAILYSDEYELVESDRFWLSSTPDVESKDWGAANKRISVNTVLKHKGSGLVFNLFTVHLDHISELSRENGLALILEKAAEYDYPAILAGDFNTNENSACYAVISEKMQDCRKVASVTDSGLTYQNYGYITETPESLPIDFCFADNAFKVFEFDIKDEVSPGGIYYSDHYAISARLGLKPPQDDAAE